MTYLRFLDRLAVDVPIAYTIFMAMKARVVHSYTNKIFRKEQNENRLCAPASLLLLHSEGSRGQLSIEQVLFIAVSLE